MAQALQTLQHGSKANTAPKGRTAYVVYSRAAFASALGAVFKKERPLQDDGLTAG